MMPSLQKSKLRPMVIKKTCLGLQSQSLDNPVIWLPQSCSYLLCYILSRDGKSKSHAKVIEVKPSLPGKRCSFYFKAILVKEAMQQEGQNGDLRTDSGKKEMRYLLNAFVHQELFQMFCKYCLIIPNTKSECSLQARKLRLRGLKHLQAKSVCLLFRVESESREPSVPDGVITRAPISGKLQASLPLGQGR